MKGLMDFQRKHEVTGIALQIASNELNLYKPPTSKTEENLMNDSYNVELKNKLPTSKTQGNLMNDLQC